MLTPSEDTITVKDWLTDYSIGKSAQYSRKLVLRQYAEANGKTLPNNPTSEQIVEAAEQVVEDIKSGKVKLYATARRFVETISKRMLPSSVTLYRSMLPGLFKATLGEPNFSHTVFDGPAGAPWHTNYVTTEKKVPDINHFKEILRRGSIRDRALFGVLASSGMRISEVVSRKISDLERRPWGGVRLRLTAQETKADTARYTFMTKETLQWIDTYHSTLPRESQWVFPGEKGQHLNVRHAYHILKPLFKQVGLVDTEGQTYTPHSMRTFADSRMSRGGIDRKYIELIIGHKSTLGATGSYRDWDEAEEQYSSEECQAKMTWLIEKTEVIKSDPKLENRVKELEAFLKELTKSLKGRTDIIPNLPIGLGLKKVLPELEDKSTDEVGTGA